MTEATQATLLERIKGKTAEVGVIGLGYVGLPLSLTIVAKGFRLLGFDIDPKKPALLAAGESYLKHIPSGDIASAVATGRFAAVSDFGRLGEPDILILCVPTPLSRRHEPDLSYVIRTAEAVAACLRPGQLVLLESTTYPGTTAEVVRPILERSGLTSGVEFFLGYSPEREDPGNPNYTTARIPKVVGADDPAARQVSQAFYAEVVDTIVPVSSSGAAEATKLTENIFRAVNIALVNELKTIFEPMGVDIWEVIDAAKTKPFGFMPFYPGPGLGGHCIPIDPFYLAWKAREYDLRTRFIELAGEINSAMPGRVVEKLALALDARAGRGLSGARILVLGVAYKKNVDDMRESSGLRIMELLEGRGAEVDFHDPHVAEIPETREYPRLAGRRGLAWSDRLTAGYDAAVIVTDHDAVDYHAVLAHAPLVIDTRDACRRAGATGPNLVLA